MRTRSWAAAAVFLVAAGCKVSGTGSVGQALSPNAPDVCKSELAITPGATSGACPSPTTCFNVDAIKNITHLFVDVGPCGGVTPAPEDVVVHVEYTNKQGTTSETIDPAKYHDKGGPCNPNGQKGEDNVPRLFWFPLTQNQDSAVVCVTVPGGGPVTLGAKVCEECLFTTAGQCCQQETPDMSQPPDMCPNKDP